MKNEPARILVVDDEKDALMLLVSQLAKAGFSVITAQSGEEALVTARRDKPALVILDVLLPGLSGLDVCRILRNDKETSDIDILVLSAKAEEVDRIVAFELGADDYVTKPFSPRELVLRVKAILKRRRAGEWECAPLCVGPIELNHALFEVRVNGKLCDLTPTEFKLLAVLAERPWKVHSRELLLAEIWGYDCCIETRTVDAHMRRLRDKMREAAELIVTVRGVGYRLAPGNDQQVSKSA
jgi:DNA-binding response OmpR family regulator